MKKQRLFLLPLMILTFLLGGCKAGKSADEYAGEQITSMKEGDTKIFSAFLEKGISESNESFDLSFPEELKETYLDFLQSAIQSVQFEVSSAKKNGEGNYSVTVTFAPLDIPGTTQDTITAYLDSMTSSDLTAETTALLEACKKAISDSPVYAEETYITLNISETDNGYHLEDDQLDNFLSQVFTNYMLPYDSACELINAHDYFTALLDACFKSDVTQLAKYTGESEESLLAQIQSEMDFSAPAELPAAYADRYSAAARTIVQNCKYEVGIPKKDGLLSYTFDITVTPNNSLIQTYAEIENISYTSLDSFSRSLVEILEKYAASPAYGEPTVITVPVNFSSLLNETDTLFDQLGNAILPTE